MKFLPALAAVLGLSTQAAVAQDIEQLIAAGRAHSTRLIQELGAQLKQELARGGPDAAVSVCKNVAPEIASRLSRESGSRIARVSLKPRNALLGTPDSWEQATLLEFDRRIASGIQAEMLETAEIVTEPQGRYFRYTKAIPVQPLCLTCHGAETAMPESVKQRLREDYPHDRATGYQTGQVRGAVTVKTFLGQ